MLFNEGDIIFDNKSFNAICRKGVVENSFCTFDDILFYRIKILEVFDNIDKTRVGQYIDLREYEIDKYVNPTGGIKMMDIFTGKDKLEENVYYCTEFIKYPDYVYIINNGIMRVGTVLEREIHNVSKISNSWTCFKPSDKFYKFDDIKKKYK